MTQEWNQNILSKESVKKWPYRSRHEWRKKNKKQLGAPPCAVPRAFPNSIDVSFPSAVPTKYFICCTSEACDLLSLVPDSPLYEGIWSKIVQTQLHNKDGGLMQPTPFTLWPQRNSFHSPEFECHATQPCMQVWTNSNITEPALHISSLTF